MTNVIVAFIQSIYVLLSGILLALLDIVKAVVNVFTQSILASYHIVQGIVGFLYSASTLFLSLWVLPMPVVSAGRMLSAVLTRLRAARPMPTSQPTCSSWSRSAEATTSTLPTSTPVERQSPRPRSPRRAQRPEHQTLTARCRLTRREEERRSSAGITEDNKKS